MHSDPRLTVGSPTARIAAVMAATLLLAVLVAGAGIAGSRLLAADGIIVVDPSGGGTVETIAEAVAMARDGDTVRVMPGTYAEPVVVDKDIVLEGDPGSEREAIVVTFTADTRRSRPSGTTWACPPPSGSRTPTATLRHLHFDGSGPWHRHQRERRGRARRGRLRRPRGWLHGPGPLHRLRPGRCARPRSATSPATAPSPPRRPRRWTSSGSRRPATTSSSTSTAPSPLSATARSTRSGSRTEPMPP